MNFIKDLDGIREDHSALFSPAAAADPQFSSRCRFLVARLRSLASDIQEHAAGGSGPRRKDWHAISRKLLAIADEVDYIGRNGPGTVMMLGLREYGDIKAMIQDMGEV
jgi:hypothetical protein